MNSRLCQPTGFHIVPPSIPISLKFVHLDINAHYNHNMSDTSMSDSYNEMVLETPYEEEEEAIDEQYIDKNIDMDDIMQPSPITTGNTTSTPNPPNMEETNENRLLALLTLRTPRRSVEAAPHNVNTGLAFLLFVSS